MLSGTGRSGSLEGDGPPFHGLCLLARMLLSGHGRSGSLAGGDPLLSLGQASCFSGHDTSRLAVQEVINRHSCCDCGPNCSCLVMVGLAVLKEVIHRWDRTCASGKGCRFLVLQVG